MRYFACVSCCLIMLLFCDTTQALVEGIYCGIENCYEVLGIQRDDDKAIITRAYRSMARLHHPDRQKNDEDRLVAEKRFPIIAAAYETLRDDAARKEYDYFLDNPEAMYYHYYQYYKRRYSPKVDVRIVAALIISCISAFQYYGQWNSYHESVAYLTKEPKYRLQAKEIGKREGLFEMKKKENGRKVTKEEVKEREEAIIRTIILEKMDIRGSYTKPSIFSILWLQMILAPYYLAYFIYWVMRWLILFWILKREYGLPEKSFIIRRNLGLSAAQWMALSDNDRDWYLSKELWKKENYTVFAEQRDAELKAKLADDASYKRYRRFLKKGGPGQIMFGPEDGPDDF